MLDLSGVAFGSRDLLYNGIFKITPVVNQREQSETKARKGVFSRRLGCGIYFRILMYSFNCHNC